MSNLVDNELVLTGSSELLTDLQSTVGNPDSLDEDERLLEFERLVPMPPGVIDQEPGSSCGPGSHAEPMDWLCWRLQNWGTAREPTYVSIEGSPEAGSLRYDFSTPNTPPIILLPVLATMWPDLSIDFAYVAMADEFAGSYHYSPGNGWSAPLLAGDVSAFRDALGTSRLASRLLAPPDPRRLTRASDRSR